MTNKFEAPINFYGAEKPEIRTTLEPVSSPEPNFPGEIRIRIRKNS
jgi:hypothetical protein